MVVVPFKGLPRGVRGENQLGAAARAQRSLWREIGRCHCFSRFPSTRVRPIVIFLLLGRYLITGISKISNIRPNIRPIGPTLAIKLSSISSDAVITYCNFQ